MRDISKEIFFKSFTKKEQKLLKLFSKIIEKDYQNFDSQRKIWEYDKSIGGFGGFSAPLNPTFNPFNKLGDYRNVFRSLQYARTDMFYCNRPRNIILDTSLHVECLVKLLLSKNKIFCFIYNKREFGKNIDQLYRKKLIDGDLFDKLNKIRKIMNLAKHDTDPVKNITFNGEDAIIFYFEVRKVGLILLNKLNHPSCNIDYEIDETF